MVALPAVFVARHQCPWDRNQVYLALMAGYFAHLPQSEPDGTSASIVAEERSQILLPGDLPSTLLEPSKWSQGICCCNSLWLLV